jgi:NTP pyrophosphatase (non-canonical NTP hydrolase)
MSFAMIEMEVIRWGEARGIIQNGNAHTQAKVKLQEELDELIDAIETGNLAGVEDAVGDCMVVLTMICAIMDIDMVKCYGGAYQEIKDRKGYLRPDGVFVKTAE